MRLFLSQLIIFLYTVIFIALGVISILFVTDVIPFGLISNALNQVAVEENLRMIVGGSGAALILFSLFIGSFAISRLQREKVISFENPDGRVTVSVAAIEDFVKRTVKQVQGIKEIRPDVIASKKGVSINARVILYSDTNIPELTDRIQSLIKSKVQDILGLDETITAKVHITKIVSRDGFKHTERKEDMSAEKAVDFES